METPSWRMTIAGVVLALCGTGGYATEAPAVAVGNRVRVFAPEAGREPVVGRVVNLESGAVLMQTESGGHRARAGRV